MPDITQAFIGMGGNLGDPHDTIMHAADTLRTSQGIATLRLSRCFRTKPVQASGPDYCNAVAEVQTSLTAVALMELLLAIEARHGRRRDHWHAPRTLDLDLIAFDALRIVGSQLTIPHPRAHERAFVLVPLCELNDRVMLGAPSSETLRPACDWLQQLPADELGDVSPW